LSPYLLQHAHNPVDWYEWGPEAIERARREDRPIFLSIGYSACHWCHVMERESFEDERIAAILNEHFVCLKVDREERPDLDEIYMAATQAFTQSGGWPMSVWLTPDLRPFYAGTYFPPESCHGRPGFSVVLQFLAEAWRSQREKVLQQADALTEAVRALTTIEPSEATIPPDFITTAASTLARAFDPVKGGLSAGGTNKFPPSMAMDVLLRAYHRSLTAGESAETGADMHAAPRTELLELVELTLEKMAHGGIYDQFGGGFARYSTDAGWLVPHFEKMLYDQALVTDIYLKAYQLTRKPLYARIARETFDYVLADLQGPEGGFYSTRDADSEGEEGRFYVWSRVEIAGVLAEDDARLFCDYYDVSDEGNWEGRSILHVPQPSETVAQRHRLPPEELERRLTAARAKLLAVREQRVKPHLDDKVLASWNGLMIASLARGSRILGEAKYGDAAARAAEFVLGRMTNGGRLLRVYRQGRAHTPGYLDDYAFMIQALIDLYEVTFDVRRLDRAVELNEQVLRHFRDEANGGFFHTADDAERLLVRAKDANDGAIPSGNSVQAMNLLRLGVLLDRSDLAAEAERLFRAFAQRLAETPYQHERLLAAVDFWQHRPHEVAFIWNDTAGGATTREGEQLDALLRAAWQTYVPNTVFAGLNAAQPDAEGVAAKIPLLAGKTPLDDRPTAYLCRDRVCQRPTSDPDALRSQLGRAR
jgi:hypothetical protein